MGAEARGTRTRTQLALAPGAFERARQLSVDTVARRRRVLGDDHIDFQRSVQHLGSNLRELGEAKAARQLHDDSLTYMRRVLGNDHFHTIFVAIELGRDLHALGQIDAARQLHEDPHPGAAGPRRRESLHH